MSMCWQVQWMHTIYESGKTQYTPLQVEGYELQNEIYYITQISTHWYAVDVCNVVVFDICMSWYVGEHRQPYASNTFLEQPSVLYQQPSVYKQTIQLGN